MQITLKALVATITIVVAPMVSNAHAAAPSIGLSNANIVASDAASAPVVKIQSSGESFGGVYDQQRRSGHSEIFKSRKAARNGFPNYRSFRSSKTFKSKQGLKKRGFSSRRARR